MDSMVKKVVTYGQNSYNRNKNFVILKRKLEELNGVKEDKQSRKRVEFLEPRKKLKQEVNIWFHEVERINEAVNDLEKEVTESKFISLVGEKVLKGIDDMDKLLVQGKSFDSLVIDDPQCIGQVLYTTTLFGEVPTKLMEEIWQYLTDDGVSKIGVYGMGGVGKTTIMKHIHNLLLKEIGRFKKVIWVTVSKEINIAKLQNSISRAINESFFDDEDGTIRAGKLNESMVNLGKYVLILDDLWQNISLEEVGIPECSNGSKLVITTRSLDVCHYLDCKEVRVPTLPQPDAWNLFLEKVGKDAEQHLDILPFVRSVADECDGLPLAIITIASSMKEVRDISAWRNARNELQGHVKSVSGVNEKIFQKLQFSYDRLGDENVKLCFLSCALYPEDFNIDIDELINLWIAEGYVEETKSMQAEIDRGHVILKKLKNCCLIEDGYYEESVKLHDVVRDMVLHLTSSRPRFFVRAGMQLKKIPDVQEWKEDLEKVSLMENYFWFHIPFQMSPPNCPILTTLLLSHCGLESIPECFFEQMPKLRILDLSQNRDLKSLPYSISNLESLTTLLLRECYHLKEMPSLFKLKDLKKLDLSFTSIEEFPHGIDELAKLRYLNLSGNKKRKMDVGLILEKLTSLQHLNIMPYNDFHSRTELGGTVGIKLLAKLEGLEMNFRNLEEFNRYMQASEHRVRREGEWHHHCMIVVGDPVEQGTWGFDYWGVKVIGFNKCEIGTENITLLSDVEDLAFKNIIINGNEGEVILSNLITCCGDVSFSSLKRFFYMSRGRSGIKKFFSFTWASRNLLNLEELTIECYDKGMEEPLEEIIGSKSESGEGTIKLPRLTYFCLSNLLELKSICSEKVSLVCDSIERIIIWNCPKLKRIPLILPLGDDALPSPPPSLQSIEVDSGEWWESTEWDQHQAKPTVKHLLSYEDSNDASE